MLFVICAVLAASLPLLLPADTVNPEAVARSAATGAGSNRIAWGSCDPVEPPAFQCAKVSVPLNWSRPNGQHIKLAVIRYVAKDQKRLLGSIFFNPGGPGESAVELVLGSAAELAGWGGGRFNVVGWDPRGTNNSDPVRCFTGQASEDRFWQGVQIPTTAVQSRAYELKTVELARRCGQVSASLLDNISTADNARDLDYMRQLVGDRQLTYVGLSYGTLIGETYANMFPTHVRAMMLDAVVDPTVWTKSAEARITGNVSSTDEVLTQFVALCQGAGPARCALANHAGTVAQRVARLFQQARRAPIPAPHSDPPGVLSYTDLLLTTFGPMRDPNVWPQYAKELDAAANGDASALETAARQLRTPLAFAKATTSTAIQCNDGPATKPVSAFPGVIAGFTQAGKLWGSILGWWQWAPCAANWPGHATERYTGPWNANTKTPILLINNLYDPATSYSNAKHVENLLGNAVLLTVASYGHPSYQLPSKCTDNWRARYLVTLATPPRDTVCAANAPFQPGASEPPGGDPDPGP